MSAVQGPCTLCGAPRPPKARKYCAACAKKQARENTRRSWIKHYRENFAGKIHQNPGRDPGCPAKPKATPGELEAAARRRSTNGWIDADVVECRGCTYWRRLGRHVYACHYPIETDCLRPMRPKDCYKHESTPYRPKGGGQDGQTGV